MIKVIVESPYAGNVEKNLKYLRACLHDCFARGEAPFASHGLYTQPGVLDDGKPKERELGIEAGLLWGESAEKTVAYLDLGVSFGMRMGIESAQKLGRRVELRWLPNWDKNDSLLDHGACPVGTHPSSTCKPKPAKSTK